jgi:hypothetical protein
MLLLGAMLGSGYAQAIVFDTTTYTTDAVALAGAASDSQSATSPPSPAALASTAHVTAGHEAAFAHASTDSSFLAAASQATAASGTATAAAVSAFDGDFLLPASSCMAAGCVAHLLLSIDFLATQAVSPGASHAALLSITLLGDGVTLLDRQFDAPGKLLLPIELPSAIHSGNLDITLTSTSDAGAGSALGFATASFRADVVPEAQTWIALVCGLFVLALARGLRWSAGARVRGSGRFPHPESALLRITGNRSEDKWRSTDDGHTRTFLHRLRTGSGAAVCYSASYEHVNRRGGVIDRFGSGLG